MENDQSSCCKIGEKVPCKLTLHKLGKSVQDRQRGEGGQAILYGYKIANFPETLDHIPEKAAFGALI